MRAQMEMRFFLSASSDMTLLTYISPPNLLGLSTLLFQKSVGKSRLSEMEKRL